MIYKSKELPLGSLQANMVGVYVQENKDKAICVVILATGNLIHYLCNKKEEAEKIKSLLLYYPTTGTENNAFEFEFAMKTN